jgi:hypothetical protein
MRTDVKKSEGSGGELTVSTDIDLKLLHYRKVDGRNCQELTAVAAVFDKDGNFVAGKQRTLTLKLRDESMDGLGQKPAETLQRAFAFSPGARTWRAWWCAAGGPDDDRSEHSGGRAIAVRGASFARLRAKSTSQLPAG